MNEIIPNLWIGDLLSSLNCQELRQHKIFAILSAMRGRLPIRQSFIRHQVEVDDTEDADIMRHLLPSIHFIQAQHDKGRGVLVHCQAGISRSTAIVAAYLIYTRNTTPDEALTTIRQVRPFAEPNPNFLRQLDLFHKSQCKISRSDKDVRRFYLDRTVNEIMNGDGSRLETEMVSNFPNSSSGSTMRTYNSTLGRRIRCKMCRQELATREHMLDHGQLGSETTSPATTGNSHHPAHFEATDPVSALVSKTRADEGPSDTSKIDTEINGDRTPPISDHHLPSTLHANEGELESNDSTQHEAACLSEEGCTAPLNVKRDQEPSTRPRTCSKPRLAPPPHAVPSDQQDPNKRDTTTTRSPPILINPKCSGYFVEPMKWMSHFLSAGELSGKIICPNKKCGAKLGNYDWAGVCCGCKEWVTPGFCINRSKVDEVVV